MSKLGRRRGKDLERHCARFYPNGKRVGILGHEDIFMSKHSCESKEREALPKWLKDAMVQAKRNRSGFGKTPFVHLHECHAEHTEDIVIMYATDWLPYVQARETGDYSIIDEDLIGGEK